MTASHRLRRILVSGGLNIHDVAGIVGIRNFAFQSVAWATLWAAVLTAASGVDRTWTMSNGFGLFQHPAIWGFLLLQACLPVALRATLRKLVLARKKLQRLIEPASFSHRVTAPVLEFTGLRTYRSKLFATAFYLFGFAAFVWNTYQNQLPNAIGALDFWDSSRHPFGYWSTRAYKLYLYVWVLPFLALVHAAILSVVLDIIRDAKAVGRLKLIPFDPDGVGGLGFVPSIVSTPIAYVLVVAAFPLGGAFWVHKALAVTPLIGLVAVLGAAMIAYGLPIYSLRSVLIDLKRETISKLRAAQQGFFDQVVDDQKQARDLIKENVESVERIEQLCARVNAISNYPHLHKLIRVAGLAATPSAVSMAIKAVEAWNKSSLP